MEYIPVEKKTVGFLPKRGNLSKAFSLEVRYHSNTNIQRYVNHNMKNTRTPRRCPCFFWALPLLLTLYLPEILVKGFFFKILSPTFAISLKHGYIYSKNIHLKYFLKQCPLFFTFSRKPGDWRPIVHTSVEAACLCWPGALHCCLFVLLFDFYFVSDMKFVKKIYTTGFAGQKFYREFTKTKNMDGWS